MILAISETLARRFRIPSTLGTITVLTGELTAPLHAYAEKVIFPGSIIDPSSGTIGLFPEIDTELPLFVGTRSVDNAATSEITSTTDMNLDLTSPKGSDVSFQGLPNPESIAGDQRGRPECGVHAVGNIIQMNNPGLDESINKIIMEIELRIGGLVLTEDGFALAVEHYKSLLEYFFNIPAHWERFDPVRIMKYLKNDHGILLIGDPYYLDEYMYQSTGTIHAFNITDIIEKDEIPYYAGLDSNHPGKIMLWPVKNVHRSVEHTPYKYNALITDSPVKWPCKI